MEFTHAVAAELIRERNGICISPSLRFKDMDDPEILETLMLAASAPENAGVAYLHV
jgi:N-ethylmaleimide reductase